MDSLGSAKIGRILMGFVFFFLLKVVQAFKARLERGFGFPEELQPCWDDKASIQVMELELQEAPERFYFTKGKKNPTSLPCAGLVLGVGWLEPAPPPPLGFHVNNLRSDPGLSNSQPPGSFSAPLDLPQRIPSPTLGFSALPPRRSSEPLWARPSCQLRAL